MDEQNSETFLGLRKRKAGTLMEQEELQKRRTPQHTSVQTLGDLQKSKEDQVDKYIQELETKNKALLAKITDLSSLNKKLSEKNLELSNKFDKPDSSGLQNCSVKNSVHQVSREPKTGRYQLLESSAEVLSTQALVALWEEVSSIPLPQCSCSKSQTAVRRRANFKTKKYREIEHIKLECKHVSN